MNLHDIKGSYDVIISLGSWCGVAAQLKRHNLRTFSGPLDWVLSPSSPPAAASVTEVCRLLTNKFQAFMELDNMTLEQQSEWWIFDEDGNIIAPKNYFVRDTYYNITSVHDFPVVPNQEWYVTYSSYKEKLNRRIINFLDKIANSKSILFIRWGANQDEFAQLMSAIKELAPDSSKLLIVNTVTGLENVIDDNIMLDNICSIKIPAHSNLYGDDQVWDFILDGITLT